MRAGYVLTVLFLRLWLLVAFLIAVYSLSDFAFRRPHSFRVLLHRLALCVVWPLALASAKGRDVLWGGLKRPKGLEQLNPTAGPSGWDFSHAACPDCGSRYFHPGPRGEAARNIKCAGCGAKFWYAPPLPPRRIHDDDKLYNLGVREELERL
jgi:hypothetical protein